ncbi:MAG: YcgN family cysteine cluster protein [Pseudomonadales bacterium]|nr:YcgN family cysteine cluster protein [Pseudomonadales bacterium]MCP5331556.1 YcgN family cysteine cluster protein [Pseudomonadales bacterium]MCP5343439.1 YcgN family cysteine cluster protein [Pseudomonadales bacterium]
MSHREEGVEAPFWERPLAELSQEQWEALCDGCGRCCLKKLINDRDESVHYTRVVCRYLDTEQCRCTQYKRRQTLVPDCLVLDMELLPELGWIPDTCAYRLRYENKPLPQWHPLISGSRAAINAQQISVSGKVISEEYVHEDGLEEHIIRWVNAAC